MQRYFLLKDYEEIQPSKIQVSGEVFHHITRVMRMKEGARVYLIFNHQKGIVAEITEITAEMVSFREIEPIIHSTELPIEVSLFCGFPKGDKLELIVQKATELGASEIIGFPAKASVVKWNDKKRSSRQERLNKIGLEAAEQSHRLVSPKVKLLETSQALFESLLSFEHILVAYEETAKQGLHSQLVATLQEVKQGDRLAFVFGPEGGLAPEEIVRLREAGAKVCSLGPRILRTETAPLYALSAVSYQLELMKGK